MSNETIQRLTMALTMIGNLPLEFNTRARAIAQEAVKAPPEGWRDPLTESEISKLLYRGELWHEMASLKPTEREKSMNTDTQKETQYQPPQIDMIPVESSNIESVGHDGNETLRMKFKSGPAHYDYVGVPEQKFFDLVNSPSVGKAWRGVVGDIKGIKL